MINIDNGRMPDDQIMSYFTTNPNNKAIEKEGNYDDGNKTYYDDDEDNNIYIIILE